VAVFCTVGVIQPIKNLARAMFMIFLEIFGSPVKVNLESRY